MAEPATGTELAAELQDPRDAAEAYQRDNMFNMSTNELNATNAKIKEYNQKLQALATMGVIASIDRGGDLYTKIQKASGDLKGAIDSLERSEKSVGRALSILGVAVLLVTGVIGKDPTTIYKTLAQINTLLHPSGGGAKTA